MIRRFRIALANWIMPRPVMRSGTRYIREAMYGPHTKLTVVDGQMVETFDPGHNDETKWIMQRIVDGAKARAVDPPVRVWKPGAEGFGWVKSSGPTIGDKSA